MKQNEAIRLSVDLMEKANHEMSYHGVCDRKLVVKALDLLRPLLDQTSAGVGDARYLALVARRFQNAVAALGEKAPYNNMTWFEAPIVKAPTAEIGEEAQKRWFELNQAGIALRDEIERVENDKNA